MKLNKQKKNRPKYWILRMLARITRDSCLVWPDAEIVINKVINRYVYVRNSSRKYLFCEYGQAFETSFYIECFEKRNSIKIALYQGKIIVSPTRHKIYNWLTFDEYNQHLEMEKLNRNEWEVKQNFKLLRKLNRERLKCQRLQQQAI